jgi:hypothetical protein
MLSDAPCTLPIELSGPGGRPDLSAARTRALDFADGTLRVEVPDAGWRKELQALAPRYLVTLNRYGAEKVTRVEFTVAGRKQASSAVPNKPSRSKRA